MQKPMGFVLQRGIYCVLACFLFASSLGAEDIRLTVIHSNMANVPNSCAVAWGCNRVNKIRNTPVDGIANRWDLTLGLVYDLGWKWY